ncbi:transposase [Burkholderia cenocepacia]|uniref:transposase n=1 Tax=Burkholderia cenocepacia TaxID=95486 RepID=UPI0030FA1985
MGHGHPHAAQGGLRCAGPGRAALARHWRDAVHQLGGQAVLVHTVIGTAANVNDVTQAASLLHGQEQHAWGYAGYQGVDKREETQGSKTQWHMAMRPVKRRALDPERLLHQLLEKAEWLKASVRAKVEHPFRVIKQQFGYGKVRYRGLDKNTSRLTMLFAMSNLWMARKRIMSAQG